MQYLGVYRCIHGNFRDHIHTVQLNFGGVGHRVELLVERGLRDHHVHLKSTPCTHVDLCSPVQCLAHLVPQTVFHMNDVAFFPAVSNFKQKGGSGKELWKYYASTEDWMFKYLNILTEEERIKEGRISLLRALLWWLWEFCRAFLAKIVEIGIVWC